LSQAIDARERPLKKLEVIGHGQSLIGRYATQVYNLGKIAIVVPYRVATTGF